MTGDVILRDADGQRLLTMNRPEPPESDTIVATSNQGDRKVYVFDSLELDVPVYVLR